MQHPYALTANFGTSATITSVNARPNGVMGATYDDTLHITGGGGLTIWSVSGGALPQGVTLGSSGVVSGFPRQSGNFSYTATVVSCDTKSRTFTLSVVRADARDCRRDGAAVWADIAPHGRSDPVSRFPGQQQR